MTAEAYLARSSVIAPESVTKTYEGAAIFESAGGIVDGFRNGEPLAIGGNVAATGLSLLGAVMDPVQEVFAAGVGWLMEHVSLLREPLDRLAGDPKAIEGHAKSWRQIESRIYQATDAFASEVRRSTDAWAAESLAAYRRRALDHAESVQALGKIAELMSQLTTVAGAVVGVFRNTIRDIVAEVVGACISKAVQAVTVVLIPKVVAEVAILVAATTTRILTVLKDLLKRLDNLRQLAGPCGFLLEQVGKASRNVTRLQAFRVEAAGTAIVDPKGWAGWSRAYRTLSDGNIAAHGNTEHLIVETARTAGQTNSSQNSGSSGTTLIEDDPEPTPIDFPS
ncbi:hypothetical protein [Actinoplanes aureus]|uniref:Uncharacterized protein n=1 Tax=Actinoplanes aureus TaxID=2792083 RepID=A0A931C957_9ACTN|nr:hypothetical protein [Actinoplanes aureus]MBG0563017.1 hypothetical protein [Actinoplanes aureus]